MSKRKQEPSRWCAQCYSKLRRKRYASGRLEGFENFIARKYCNLNCANKRKGDQDV
jgi:hypothetical protein